MDFYPGGSLHDFLRTHVLDLQALCDLASSASSGLAHLHGEIVINQVVVKPSIAHRDLKSKNILVKPDGTCAIGDFGLALTFSSSDVEDKEMQGQVRRERWEEGRGGGGERRERWEEGEVGGGERRER